jgi:hypothetical protein
VVKISSFETFERYLISTKYILFYVFFIMIKDLIELILMWFRLVIMLYGPYDLYIQWWDIVWYKFLWMAILWFVSIVFIIRIIKIFVWFFVGLSTGLWPDLWCRYIEWMSYYQNEIDWEVYSNYSWWTHMFFELFTTIILLINYPIFILNFIEAFL